MLLAKLKSVVLGLAALAVFTTGVGVLAQDGTSDGDRLKNVERKLDRLLEVLGGSIRRAPADAHIAKIPAPATTSPNSSSSPVPAAVPPTAGIARRRHSTPQADPHEPAVAACRGRVPASLGRSTRSERSGRVSDLRTSHAVSAEPRHADAAWTARWPTIWNSRLASWTPI